MSTRKPTNVFISSTTEDLVHYRRASISVVESLHRTHGAQFPLHVVAMDTELLDGERQIPVALSKSWVADADWVILIVGWHYGWTAPGESCSVTEWEYRAATLSVGPDRQTRKKLFVYLAGDPDEDKTGEWVYEPLDSRVIEPIDLRLFRPGSESLRRFRAELRQGSFAYFRNIEDFKRQLNDALSRRIVRDNAAALGPVVDRLGLAKFLNPCFKEVRLLATHKRLHDALHHVRQDGVRKVREDLLRAWSDGGGMARRDVQRLVKLAGVVGGHLQRIRTELEVAPDLHKGSDDLLWVSCSDLPINLEGSKAEFAESIDDYASRVQKAFTGCNHKMAQSARQLEVAYAALRGAVKQALTAGGLSADTQDALDKQVSNSSLIHDRLQTALRNHSYWQAMHDELEQLDKNLETEDEQERNDQLNRFFRLYCQFSDVKPRSGRVRAMPDLLSDAEAYFDSTESGLDAWRDPMSRMERHLRSFSRRCELESYEALRKAFDDLFFEVDIETLRTVERSEGRVDAMEAGLRGIEDVITRGAGTPGGGSA